MPNHNDVVTDFVAGDDLSIRRRLTDTVTTDPVANSWLSIRDSSDDTAITAILVKGPISTTPNSDGEVEDDGATNGTSIVRFDLSPTDTRAIGTVGYYFDIQVRTSGGKTYTPVKGTIRAVGEVTSA